MLNRLFAIGLLCFGLASPASAQTVGEDVRCILLGNAFTKVGSDDRQKGTAAQAVMFYAGRLDGRANEQTIIAEMRAQTATFDAKTAGAEMTACAARMQRALQTVQAAGRAVAPPRQH
jgi:hypothetical protein